MDTQKFAIPLAVIVAGALIAGALYISSKPKPTSVAQKPTSSDSVETRAVSASDHIIGNPNAEIVIIEYSDTECPFCKQFHQTMRQVMSEYGTKGTVAWVYRHFPIDQLHSKARKEAEATECANELGGVTKFWDYINTLYERTNSNNSFDPAGLPVIAKDVGLDVSAFKTCLASGKYATKIQADYEDAIKAGGRGTPYSVVIIKKDGTKIPINGAESFENVKSTLDLLLQK
jgi:protein-disulfide isomerase